MSVKDEIKESSLFRCVKIITLIIPCVLIVMLFLSFIMYLYVVPVNYALGGQFTGVQAFIFGGYGAIILLFISATKLFKEELNRPSTLTLISTILVGINVVSVIGVYIFIDMDPNISYLYVDLGFYLLLVILVLSVVDTILTSKLKKRNQF